jgi:TonB family protein
MTRNLSCFKYLQSVILTLFIVLGFENVAQSIDTTYYDINWKAVNAKDSASFYGTRLRINDSTVVIRDYYLSDTLQNKGQYINGTKKGRWTYYYPNGKVKSDFEYTQNGTSKHWYVFSEKELTPNEQGIYHTFNHWPKFKDDARALDEYINKTLVLPKDAVKNGFTFFKTKMRLIIDENGKIISAEEEKTIGFWSNGKFETGEEISNLKYGVESTLIDLFLNMPNWNPAIVRDQPVKSSLSVSVKYGNLDTTFFNAEWKEIGSFSKAAYYRLTKKDKTDKTDTTKFIEITYFKSGQVQQEDCYSNYANSVMTGPSKAWYSNGQLKMDASYVENKLNGKLQTFWDNGQLKRKEIYDHGKLMTGEVYNPDGSPTSYYDYEIGAQFPGGVTEMVKFLGKSIVYPKKARRQNVSGKVFLKFYIDTDGLVKDILIEKGVSKEIDAEAIRVLKTMPAWTSALLDGEKVKSYYRLPLNFKLN